MKEQKNIQDFKVVNAISKEKLLNSQVKSKIKMDINGVSAEVDVDSLRQLLFDFRNIDDGFRCITSFLNEFEEFVHDFYPDEAPSGDLKKFINCIRFTSFFFADLKTNEDEVKES